MGETYIGTVTGAEAEAEATDKMETTEMATMELEPQNISYWRKVVALVQAALQ